MAMNIKNQEAHRIALEISRKTGKSLTEVVLQALRDLQRTTEQADRSRRAKKLIEELRAELKGEPAPDIDSLLYDPVTGLPR